jgi:hypothetical protein
MEFLRLVYYQYDPDPAESQHRLTFIYTSSALALTTVLLLSTEGATLTLTISDGSALVEVAKLMAIPVETNTAFGVEH